VAQDFEAANSQRAGFSTVSQSNGYLHKIPSTREDVFSDDTLSPRDKRSLMKFLRYVISDPAPEAQPNQDATLSLTLTTQYVITASLHRPLLALSLSYHSAGAVKTRTAVPRIRRHMRSIGAFGPGFGAVMPKYGGGAEIAQVACRASAVGGAVYVLGRGLHQIIDPIERSAVGESSSEELLRLELSDGEEIKTRFVTGGIPDLSPEVMKRPASDSDSDLTTTTHSISIVSSPLEQLFPPTSESGPVPAGAIVVCGGDGDEPTSLQASTSEMGPIYLVVHSSESGECPAGQCKCELPVQLWLL
jgi:Rab proteins geranylgeranyltransferase component A